jgi:hypothetical protein
MHNKNERTGLTDRQRRAADRNRADVAIKEGLNIPSFPPPSPTGISELMRGSVEKTSIGVYSRRYSQSHSFWFLAVCHTIS